MPVIFPPKHIGLRHITLFQGLAACDMERIQSRIVAVHAAARSHLITTGVVSEWIYFVLEGTVCVYRFQGDGRRIVLNMVGAGETLGEIGALDAGGQKGHSANTVTTEESAVYKMRSSDFCELKSLLPQLARNVEQLLISRVRFATDYSEVLWPHKVYPRVARLMWALGNRYANTPAQERVAIPVRLPQHEIADWVGASRRHVGESMERLEEEGIVQPLSNHRLIINNLPKLHLRTTHIPQSYLQPLS
jgi:CRP/FNR family transcriptional regulator, cyclic AMP receptor protein